MAQQPHRGKMDKPLLRRHDDSPTDWSLMTSGWMRVTGSKSLAETHRRSNLSALWNMKTDITVVLQMTRELATQSAV